MWSYFFFIPFFSVLQLENGTSFCCTRSNRYITLLKNALQTHFKWIQNPFASIVMELWFMIFSIDCTYIALEPWTIERTNEALDSQGFTTKLQPDLERLTIGMTLPTTKVRNSRWFHTLQKTKPIFRNSFPFVISHIENVSWQKQLMQPCNFSRQTSFGNIPSNFAQRMVLPLEECATFLVPILRAMMATLM